MLNFAVGPVMSPPEVLEAAARSSPYFRTPEFSAVMLENERMLLSLLHAPAGSRCVFLTTLLSLLTVPCMVWLLLR